MRKFVIIMTEIPFVELTEQEEEKLEQNIVWIFGANRSGTTWLAKQLEASDFYFMNEPLLGEHLGISIRSKLRINIFKDFSVKLPISESLNQSLGFSLICFAIPRMTVNGVRNS